MRAIVVSKTLPVLEAKSQNVTGHLVKFFDVVGLVHEVCAILDNPAACQRIGINAPKFALANYDPQTVCLLGQLAWVQSFDGTN